MRANYKYFLFSITFCILIFSGLVYYKYSKVSVNGWFDKIEPDLSYRLIDENIKESFLIEEKYSYQAKYDKLFQYFLSGYLNYKSTSSALVFYPGEKSYNTHVINGLEGFARFFPVATAYILDKNDSTYHNEKKINLSSILKTGILNGTNPNHLDYWGDIDDFDQRIVEAADIALGLWISKKYIWEKCTLNEKKQIFGWLSQVFGKKTVENNWMLFPVMVFKSMEALTPEIKSEFKFSEDLYWRFKKDNYLGDGWFNDDPQGTQGIDYYNAWGIQYSLFWINQIDPGFDSDFINGVNAEFVEFYKLLFSKNGFPMMGRSTCYRIAAPVPLLANLISSHSIISQGEALNAFDSTWSYFIQNNALESGQVTQGFFETDLSLLDGYSGTGSCLWSLRSLSLAFYLNDKISFFSNDLEPLPIEVSDYFVTNETIGWSITGDKKNQEIVLRVKQNSSNDTLRIRKYNLIHKIKEMIFKAPQRPNNHSALYDNPIYSNRNEIYIQN